MTRTKYIFFILAFFLFLPFVHSHYAISGGNSGVTVIFEREPPVAGDNSNMAVILSNPETGAPIRELDTVHERKLHVAIVGEDLETFTHTHPDDFDDGFKFQNQGVYTIHHVFEKAGNYAVIVDYTVAGKNYISVFEVEVFGNPKLEAPEYDFSKQKKFGKYLINFSVPDEIEVGKEYEFSFNLEKDGKEVNDLELYLGSEVHVFAVSDDFRYAEHTHSYIPGHFLHSGSMGQKYSGPNIPIHLTFIRPGDYAVFAQFKHEGKIITSNFMLEVNYPNMTAPVKGTIENKTPEKKITALPLIFDIAASAIASLAALYFIKRIYRKKRS